MTFHFFSLYLKFDGNFTTKNSWMRSESHFPCMKLSQFEFPKKQNSSSPRSLREHQTVMKKKDFSKKKMNLLNLKWSSKVRREEFLLFFWENLFRLWTSLMIYYKNEPIDNLSRRKSLKCHRGSLVSQSIFQWNLKLLRCYVVAVAMTAFR